MPWSVGILAIGILGGKETSFPGGHIACDVIENIANDSFILLVAGDLEGVQIRQRELRLVVEHFLKMRYVPETVDRIPMEAAPEMIVHSTGRHFLKSDEKHFQSALAHFGL